MVFLPPSSPPLRMKIAAMTATTPPTMMPNVPLLFLFMTIFQRLPRDRVPIARGNALRIRQNSSQNWGHFEEMHTHALAVQARQRCANVRAAPIYSGTFSPATSPGAAAAPGPMFGYPYTKNVPISAVATRASSSSAKTGRSWWSPMVMTPGWNESVRLLVGPAAFSKTACGGRVRAATKYQMAAVGSLKHETG